MNKKRKYVLRERAAKQADTRLRIVEAACALHQEIGPAETQISQIAVRAGVQRVTVYNHFPDEASLFAACSAHWRALHPAPDLQRWRKVTDAGRRLRHGLRDLYAWYRETSPMTANVLRDAELLPALRSVIEPGLVAYLRLVPEVLVEPFRASGTRRRRIVAAARAAADVGFWRALEGLGDRQAAELGAGLVEAAARARGKGHIRRDR